MQIPYFRSWNKFDQEGCRLYSVTSYAVKILFTIPHHNLFSLPEIMSTSELYQLAVACDKCNVSHIVSPRVHCRDWIDKLWRKGRPCDAEWHRWAWILSTFPESRQDKNQRLELVLDIMAANMRKRGGKWILPTASGYLSVSKMRNHSRLWQFGGRYSLTIF
jgi:hypothetical protein